MNKSDLKELKSILVRLQQSLVLASMVLGFIAGILINN
jgi:hypothetical protein